MTIEEMLSADGYEDPCKHCNYTAKGEACKRPVGKCPKFQKYYAMKWDLTVKILRKELEKRKNNG